MNSMSSRRSAFGDDFHVERPRQRQDHLDNGRGLRIAPLQGADKLLVDLDDVERQLRQRRETGIFYPKSSWRGASVAQRHVRARIGITQPDFRSSGFPAQASMRDTPGRCPAIARNCSAETLTATVGCRPRPRRLASLA
jgi:hypothetical protein